MGVFLGGGVLLGQWKAFLGPWGRFLGGMKAFLGAEWLQGAISWFLGTKSPHHVTSQPRNEPLFLQPLH
jgi:hypothetical protein